MALRVLHLIDSGGLYGAERMLLMLVEEQQRQGLEPMILSAGEPGIDVKPLENEARRLGLPITAWRMRKGLNLPEAWRILRWARQQGYQLLHSHGYKFNILTGLWPARVRGLPVVATLHGYVRAPRWSKMAVYEALDRRMLKRLDRIVIVNDDMRELLPASTQAPGRCVHIPNGISPAPPPTAELPAAVAHFLQPHKTRLLAVGRLSREKGFDLLVEVLRRGPAALSQAGLVVVGAGAERDRLEAAIRSHGLEQRILLAGYQANAAAWMPHFDALVMPSLTEGLPITILEALRAELPIIASAVGALPTVLENVPSAKLVPPGDPDALESALAQWITENQPTNPEHFRTALQPYTATTMAERYHAVYQGLLAAKR